MNRSRYTLIAASLLFFLAENILGAALPSPENQTIFKTPTHVDNILKTHDLGVGVMIGTANGITGKYWVTERSAVNTGVAFSPNNVALSVDYLYHLRYAISDLTASSAGTAFVPFGGIGLIGAFGSDANSFLRVSTEGTTLEGLRIPFGMEYLSRTIPAGFYAEAVPGLGFTPENFGFFQVDAGARWYF